MLQGRLVGAGSDRLRSDFFAAHPHNYRSRTHGRLAARIRLQ
ncbi:hypothetical protein [Rhizobium bangladeshense]|nr:hypothetical protein [Rhizobium bangladeshense]